MAAQSVTLIGTFSFDTGGTVNGTFSGVAAGSGVPAHPIAPGGPPPEIWPSPGHPAHPIAPGGPPNTIWPDPGHPAHPIVIPEPPTPEVPPGTPPDSVVKSPAPGSWGYYTDADGAAYSAYRPAADEASPKG